MSTALGARFWPGMFALLAVIVLIAVLPLVAAYVAYWVAEAFGCRLNEAGVNPCVMWGLEMGSWLAFLGLLGWLGLVTLPIGALALLLWLVVAIGFYFRGRGRAA